MEILATQLADLLLAVQRSDEKQIRRLLAVNVSPNQRNTQGTTALMVATKIGNSKILKMLHGAIQNNRPSAQLFFSQIVSSFSTAVSPTVELTSFIAADLPTAQVTLPMLVDPMARANDVMSVSLPICPNELSGFSNTSVLRVEDQPTAFYPEEALVPVAWEAAQSLEAQSLEAQSLEAQPLEAQPLEAQLPTGQFLDDQVEDDPTTGAPITADPAAAGQTALLKAAICNNDSGAVKALLAAGASVQSTSWYDTPLLVLAAQNANNDIVKALLEAGASVNRGYSRLPLNVASERGKFEIVHTLLCAGAYLEAKEENGYTALMCAAAAGHLLIVQTLIACGANVNANYYGKTPLMLTAINGHTKVYDFLYPYTQLQGVSERSLQKQALLAAQHFQLDRELFTLLESDLETASPH